MRPDQPWYLVEGAVAFDTPDGRHIVATPDGEFIQLNVDQPGWYTLCQVIVHRRLAVEVLAESPAAEVPMRAALDLLDGESLLTTPEGTSHSPVVGSVLVIGTGPLAYAAADLLTAARIVTVRSEAGPIGDATVVVACADWLPDQAWLELDGHCTAGGVLWHRAWREGASAWVGPLTLPGRSATYRDLRLRRLAASDWPEELEASWRHVAEPGIRAPDWDPATLAVIAGTMVADVVAHLDAGDGTLVTSDPSREWRGFDLRNRVWTSHPVLPLPIEILR